MASNMIKLKLSHQQVRLLTRGARFAQEEPTEPLSPNIKWLIQQKMPLLTFAGAKLYPLGANWYSLMGYGYGVSSKMPERFPTLRVDERDDLNLLGFAA